MNFVQSEFWWQLLGLGLPLLGLRSIAQRMGVGKLWLDRSILLVLSLLLFWSLSPLSFGILCLEGVLSYSIIRFFQRSRPESHQTLTSRLVLAGGTIALLAVLGAFKYFQPAKFLEMLPIVGGLLSIPKAGFVAPGLSFHTFQMISAMVDAYQRKLTEPIKKLDYANFVFLFPQAVSGPIERWDQLGKKLSTFQFSFQQFEPGLCWMSLGLFMKLVLAENLRRYSRSPIADIHSAWCIWLYLLFYGLRLYFDFAGYSFIALGLGKAIGIDLEINFLAPYVATNIQEFWRRWNVTLSTWFRDYLFILLGGSRVRWGLLNLLAVFLASGIWHGSGLNFIFWGLYHGILMIIYRVWSDLLSRYPKLARQLQLPIALSWLLTFGAVILGWLFFVETDVSRLQQILAAIFSWSSYRFDKLIYEWTMFQMISPFSLWIVTGLSLLVLGYEFYNSSYLKRMPYSTVIQPRFAIVLLGLVIVLADREPGQFIYFSF